MSSVTYFPLEYHYFAAQSPTTLMQLSHHGKSLKFCCGTNMALVLATIQKQLLPRPCACSVSNVASRYSSSVLFVLHSVSSPVKRLTAVMAEFLNLCQDGVNAATCSGILSKNNGNSVQRADHFQCCNGVSFNCYALWNFTQGISLISCD